MSKSLNSEQRERLYQKRGRLRIDFGNLAEILNTKKDHMVQAQIGLPIPDEVADAVITWMET